jgi:hypothetical protein
VDQTKPLAGDIPTEKAWRVGRRIYVRCGYQSKLNGQLRGIGAKWDGEVRALWVGSGKLDQVLPLVRATAERAQQIERIKALGLWVKVPYDAEDIRAAAKNAGGVFDGELKLWAMPDDATYTAIGEQVRAYNERIQAQRNAERAELEAAKQRRLAEERDNTEAARLAARDVLINRSGRRVIGEPGWVDGYLHDSRGIRRPQAERAAPQPGDLRKLRDGRRGLVLSCTVTFFSERDVDDDFAPGGTSAEVGWYYRYEYVPVEPTAQERSDDDREAAEKADLQELHAIILAVERGGDAAEWTRQWTGGLQVAATITKDSPGGMSVHGGQIILTATGELFWQHPGWYDDWRSTERRIADPDLVTRIRAALAGGSRRRGAFEVRVPSSPGCETQS